MYQYTSSDVSYSHGEIERGREYKGTFDVHAPQLVRLVRERGTERRGVDGYVPTYCLLFETRGKLHEEICISLRMCSA